VTRAGQQQGPELGGAAGFSPGSDLHVRLRRFYDDLWSGRRVDVVLLELCRLRMAVLLGAEGEQRLRSQRALELGLDEAKIAVLSRWPNDSRFNALERSALNYAEQFAIDAHSVTDDDVAAVAAHLSTAEVVALTVGLGTIEMLIRTRLALGTYDSYAEATVVPYPLGDFPLY
jgi:alkylhydroperoxidase family enzyme